MIMRIASINKVIDKPDNKILYVLAWPWYFFLDAIHCLVAFAILISVPEYFTSAEKTAVLIFMIVYFRYRNMLKQETQNHFKLMKVRLFNYLTHRYLLWAFVLSGIGFVIHKQVPYYQDDYILIALVILCLIYVSMTKVIKRVLKIRALRGWGAEAVTESKEEELCP